MWYALCDCNNFFVSCERVFRPDLRNKPVVVLSGNDGCVVSRSNEAKAMGIKMGVPYFEIKAWAEKNGLVAFSSNFNLYGDLSARVMSILRQHTQRLEQYSVDEAFLYIDYTNGEEAKAYFEQVAQQIMQWVGIPVSFGIAKTKTLAKIASKYAKLYPGYKSVCVIDNEEKREKALKGFAIEDVWGIGRRTNKKLSVCGIKSAWDFATQNALWVQNMLHKPGLDTWKELNGEDCIDISAREVKQSITQSRTFPTGISDRKTIEKAMMDFLSACAQKLRAQESVCKSVSFYAMTSRFNEEEFFAIEETVILPTPTALTAEIAEYMLQRLRTVWRPFPYKKVGVILSHIDAKKNTQALLFDERERERDERLQASLDRINAKYAKTAITMANQTMGGKVVEISKKERLSPCYTTNVRDILVVKAK